MAHHIRSPTPFLHPRPPHPIVFTLTHQLHSPSALTPTLSLEFTLSLTSTFTLNSPSSHSQHFIHFQPRIHPCLHSFTHPNHSHTHIHPNLIQSFSPQPPIHPHSLSHSIFTFTVSTVTLTLTLTSNLTHTFISKLLSSRRRIQRIPNLKSLGILWCFPCWCYDDPTVHEKKNTAGSLAMTEQNKLRIC